jgi:hypothetical protein
MNCPFWATASAGELRVLAEQAAVNLDCRAWEGYRSERGGWQDWDPQLEGWHRVTEDFIARVREGARELTEGLTSAARFDLACELAHLRRWCPG